MVTLSARASRAAGFPRGAVSRASGVLLVLREPPPRRRLRRQPPTVPANLAEGPEVLLAFADDGCVVALARHVDLGTGLQTAYAQLVAEELGLPLSRVTVILGDGAPPEPGRDDCERIDPDPRAAVAPGGGAGAALAARRGRACARADRGVGGQH
jgi:hypothetical protein